MGIGLGNLIRTGGIIQDDHHIPQKPQASYTGALIEGDLENRRSNYKWIDFGPKNDLPNYLKMIVCKSGYAKGCLRNLCGWANSEAIITEGDSGKSEDVQMAKAIERGLRMKWVKKKMISDLLWYGGTTPQIIWGPKDQVKSFFTGFDRKGVEFYPSSIMDVGYETIRFKKPRKSVTGKFVPTRLYIKADWGYNSSFLGAKKNKGLRSPVRIAGANLQNWGDTFFEGEKLVAAHWYGKLFNDCTRYYGLPMYHSETGLHAIWQDSNMSRFHSSLIDNGMYLNFCTIIYRSPKSNEKAESKKRKEEKQFFANQSQVERAGGSILFWADPKLYTKEMKDLVEFKSLPRIQNTDFYEYLNNSILDDMLFVFGIPEGTFVGRKSKEGGGLNNNSDHLLFKFEAMNNATIVPIQDVVADFYEYIFRDCFGLDVNVVLDEPLLLKSMKERFDKTIYRGKQTEEKEAA